MKTEAPSLIRRNNNKDGHGIGWRGRNKRPFLWLMVASALAVLSLINYAMVLHPPRSDFGFAPPSRIAFASSENSIESNQDLSKKAAAEETTDASPEFKINTTTEGDHSFLDKKKDDKITRRHLVFHVGPPKTGTTTLQTDFTGLREYLEADNYVYAGRFYHPATANSNSSFLHRNWTELHETARIMLKRKVCPGRIERVQCLAEFRRMLEELYPDKNILFSDESWGAQVWKTPDDYAGLQQLATSLGYELTIVVGYRPFFEWIRSDLFQRYRLDMGKAEWKTAWPGKQGGKSIPWLFPSYFRRHVWYEKEIHRFTDFIMANAHDTVDHLRLVHLMNSASKDDSSQPLESLRTQFVCHALPDAPHTCTHSRDMDRVQQGLKPGVVVGIQSRNTQVAASDSMHVNHDLIATRAAELGMVNVDQHSRSSVRQALRDFVEDDLGLSPLQGYPLTCPSAEDLSDLLKQSLELEMTCLGLEWAARVEPITRATFQQVVADGIFCTVDADAVLATEPYHSFVISHFGIVDTS